MHRLADHWGQPALMDDDAGKRLAGVFNGHIAPEVCKTVCALLHGWQDSGRYLTPRILLYGVHFLQVRGGSGSSSSSASQHASRVVHDACMIMQPCSPAHRP